MALVSNRPDVARLQRQLQVAASATPGVGVDVANIDPELLAELLDDSADWIEGEAHTAYDARARVELRDGNGTPSLQLFRGPLARVDQVQVSLPVLALHRVYTAEEVKVYPLQDRITIFTFKLAAEHASLHLDRMVYGNLLPPLPQCVEVRYCFGFWQVDPTGGLSGGPRSTCDGGLTWVEGNQLLANPDFGRRLRQLQGAAIADAAASVLAQAASLGVQLIQTVSFDGFSKSMNPQAYGPNVEALIQRRDQLLARRKKMMLMSTSLG